MTISGCARPATLLSTIALTLVACGSVPTRETALTQVVPLTAPVLAPGVESNSDKLFVVVTFSGGGKRAAAFSYGVLEAPSDVEGHHARWRAPFLLDEIDPISAVSGGAFTAAYYALHGHETLRVTRPLPQPRHGAGSVEQGARARELGPPGEFDDQPQRPGSRVLRRKAVRRRHGAGRHYACTARDHYRHRPGTRQAFCVHTRAVEWHLRGSEKCAGGARGIRIRRHSGLLRAAGMQNFAEAADTSRPTPSVI